MRFPMFFTAAALLVFAGACGGATTTPRIRVARDLGCTAEHTGVQRLSQHRWQVTGCGRTAVYVCTYPVRDCWREGSVQSMDPPMARAPEGGEQQVPP